MNFSYIQNPVTDRTGETLGDRGTTETEGKTSPPLLGWQLTWLGCFCNIPVLNDVQRQGRGEGAELVRQQGQEPSSEICRA